VAREILTTARWPCHACPHEATEAIHQHQRGRQTRRRSPLESPYSAAASPHRPQGLPGKMGEKAAKSGLKIILDAEHEMADTAFMSRGRWAARKSEAPDPRRGPKRCPTSGGQTDELALLRVRVPRLQPALSRGRFTAGAGQRCDLAPRVLGGTAARRRLAPVRGRLPCVWLYRSDLRVSWRR